MKLTNDIIEETIIWRAKAILMDICNKIYLCTEIRSADLPVCELTWKTRRGQKGTNVIRLEEGV